jgi:hypothetical protein
MDGREFLQRVRAHPEFEWRGVRQGATAANDEVFVLYRPRERTMAVAVSAILEHDWAELEAVITGRREPQVMTHVTRIVGYYSMVHNWNASARAQLRDRHRGNYVLPER